MDKKRKFINEHNEFVDEVLNEFVLFSKRQWEIWKQPKFWIFYLLCMGTAAVCYYIGVITK